MDHEEYRAKLEAINQEIDRRAALHHPWCNRFKSLPEGCSMCKDLYGEFPDTHELTVDELRQKYFPNVKVVGKE